MLLNYSRTGGQSTFGPISAGQGPPRGLVKTHANNWSSRMQIGGQFHAITQQAADIQPRSMGLA